MSRRSTVHLLRHGPTSATRRSLFAADEPLDAKGRDLVADWCGRLEADRAASSPLRRCLETAELAGHADPVVDGRWSELDFGQWKGLSLARAAELYPDDMSRWLEDPFGVSPPGGETFAQLKERVESAMRDLAATGETTLVVTSAGPIKAAVLSVLEAPSTSLWRIDPMPGSVTTFTAHDGIWSLRALSKEPVR
ncbi:histidine phosphatase family protein [Salininema proteolyticum]|uniref:Histidine phosphatase family protein n=1 Tax=Salininema proteolyticum TaxID=1607685 RepID=A0ABV8U5Q6_9ACTN